MSEFQSASDYVLNKNEELYQRLAQLGPAGTMAESYFWTALEYRLCQELGGMADRRFRWLWCDGFIPERYDLDGDSPRILGTIWICQGSEQERWRFELLLDHSVGVPEQIDWASLLPPENMTKWLSADLEGKQMEIEPSKAVPDRSSVRGK